MDDIYTLAEFLDISSDDARSIINRNTPDFQDFNNDYSISKKNLWIDYKSSGTTVDNNIEAVFHYYFGKGRPVNLGQKTMDALVSTEDVKGELNRFESNDQHRTSFGVNLTHQKKTYHIGRTPVKVKSSHNTRFRSISFTAFEKDGFWDPNVLFENISPSRADRSGKNFELGGRRYEYMPSTRVYYFKPYEDNEEN